MVNQEFLRDFEYDFFDDLIRIMNLHQSYLVQPTVLFEMLNVNIYRSIKLPGNYNAFSARHLRQGFGLSVFDRRLTGRPLRQVAFHELGHLLFHKDGKIHGSVNDPNSWLKKEELEANVIGCYLAAPASTMVELFNWGYVGSQVCEILDITPDMLQLRSEIMVARDELGVRSRPFNVNLW